MPTWNGTATNPLSYKDINDNVLTSVDAGEDKLKKQIEKLGPNPSTMDMLILQQGMQQWSMLCELQSTVVKTVSETLKSIVQKSS